MMKKNTFIGGVSGSLMGESFRQLWYLPAFQFILYFLAGIFPLILMEKGNNGEYALASLENSNFFFGMYIMFMPIVVSCIVMRYYHNPERSFAMHAQPYSRAKLFNTNIFAGWLMLVIPVIVMGFIYMALSGSIMVEEHDYTLIEGESVTTKLIQAYTPGDAMAWVGNSISLYTFYYALCVFAGSLVGNTVTQILGSLVFYNLTAAIAGIVALYSEMCLAGYAGLNFRLFNLILNSEPVLRYTLHTLFGVGADVEGVEIISPMWYLAIGIVILMLAKFACYNGKLEKVGDSMIFDIVELIVTAVITFIGAALLGAIFGLTFDGKGLVVVGCVIGAFVSFFLVKLILMRTAKIFNKETLKAFIASMVILIIFLLIFVGDITGFAKRTVPDGDILSTDVGGIYKDEYRAWDFNNIYVNGTTYSEDPEDISRVQELHKLIVDNKLYDWSEFGDSVVTRGVWISYKLKNGGSFNRNYTIYCDKDAEKLIEDILNSDTARNGRMISEELKDSAVDMSIYYEIYNSDEIINNDDLVITDKQKISSVIDAFNKDRAAEHITIEDMNDSAYSDIYDEFGNPVDDAVFVSITIRYNLTKEQEAEISRATLSGYRDHTVEITGNQEDAELCKVVKELIENSKA